MLDTRDRLLIEAIQHGLPITSRPYAEIGSRIDMPESEVLDRLTRLKNDGLIKRLGVIVKHRQLGYRANAMAVWNIPDNKVALAGEQICAFSFVTLCYQRPRHGKQWPYNLYCMIHGKDREKVRLQLQQVIKACRLSPFKHQVLFSNRCFKQRGALYRENLQTHREQAVYG